MAVFEVDGNILVGFDFKLLHFGIQNPVAILKTVQAIAGFLGIVNTGI